MGIWRTGEFGRSSALLPSLFRGPLSDIRRHCFDEIGFPFYEQSQRLRSSRF